MPIGAAIATVGATVYSANKQSSAAKSAANQQVAGQQAAIAEEQRQYDLSRSDEMPYMQAGTGALAQLGKLNSGDYSSFHTSPDYQFSLNQGLQGLDRSAAARGSLYSGGHSTDVVNYAEGMASKNYDDYYNKIAGLANLGQDATAHTGVLGAGAATGIANSLGNIGNAQAQGTTIAGNAWANAFQGIGSTFQHYINNRGTGQTTGGNYNISAGYPGSPAYGYGH